MRPTLDPQRTETKTSVMGRKPAREGCRHTPATRQTRTLGLKGKEKSPENENVTASFYLYQSYVELSARQFTRPPAFSHHIEAAFQNCLVQM